MKNPQHEAILLKLKRYCDGTCSREEEAEMESWLLQNLDRPEYDELFGQLFAEISVAENPEAKQRARAQLNRLLEEHHIAEPAVKPRRGFWRHFLTIVQAVVILLLGVTSVHYYRQSGKTQNWTEAYAPYGQTRQVTLPDGSNIWLRADSRILYPEEFGPKERRIYVSGEIFADIAKDAKHPFLAQTNDAEVRVLGTKFNMKAYRDASCVEVSLLEGSVAFSVTTDSLEKNEFLLRPGNTVRVDRRTGTAERYDFDVDEYSSWKDRRMLLFMNQTLEEIVTELQRSFNVQIVIRDDELRSVRYLASFINDESLVEILKALNSDHKMTITTQGDVIILSLNRNQSVKPQNTN